METVNHTTPKEVEFNAHSIEESIQTYLSGAESGKEDKTVQFKKIVSLSNLIGDVFRYQTNSEIFELVEKNKVDIFELTPQELSIFLQIKYLLFTKSFNFNFLNMNPGTLVESKSLPYELLDKIINQLPDYDTGDLYMFFYNGGKKLGSNIMRNTFDPDITKHVLDCRWRVVMIYTTLVNYLGLQINLIEFINMNNHYALNIVCNSQEEGDEANPRNYFVDFGFNFEQQIAHLEEGIVKIEGLSRKIPLQDYFNEPEKIEKLTSFAKTLPKGEQLMSYEITVGANPVIEFTMRRLEALKSVRIKNIRENGEFIACINTLQAKLREIDKNE